MSLSVGAHSLFPFGADDGIGQNIEESLDHLTARRLGMSKRRGPNARIVMAVYSLRDKRVFLALSGTFAGLRGTPVSSTTGIFMCTNFVAPGF